MRTRPSDRAIAARYDGTPTHRPTHDTIPARPTCDTHGCGDNADGPLRPGWVRVQAFGDYSRAYCSSSCVTRALIRHDLKGTSC